MKRLFTLSMLFVLVASLAQAQGYRKWDFTNWSATTVGNLAEEATKGVTGGTWSDTEKADGSNPQPGNCYWSYGENLTDGELSANGAVIAETAGLLFNTAYTSRRSLAIAVNYSTTSLGEYAGPQYLWLGGGKAKTASARLYCFIIPKVRVGQKITIVAESHKPAEARGVALYAGDCTNDANIIGEAFNPTTQASYTWEEGWTLPEGAATNEDGTVDIQVYNTNGCHLYSIEVGDNSQKAKVAYLFNGAKDSEEAYQVLNTAETFDVTTIEANSTITLDDLAEFDAMVLSPTLSNAEAIASLKDIRPFVPTLNLNPSLYEAWGMGTTAESGIGFADVTSTQNHALFRGLELIEGDGLIGLELTEANYQAVSLTGNFANDQVLATVMGGEAVAIHAHNMSHNGYLYIPAFDKAPQLLNNAVSVLLNSKAAVGPAPKPSISQTYKNMETIVTLKSGVPAAEIFYTTDGSEPTTASTPYTEPFSVTAAGTVVKAVVLGEGYLLSEVAEQAIELKQQAPTPTISVVQKGNQSIVTMACSAEDVNIYYNYEASSDSTKSSKYTEPIVLITPQTISAFTASQALVASELAQQEVTIEKPLVFTETLAHMDANKQEFYQNFFDSEDKPNSDSNSKVAYFFSWGKNKSSYSYYDTTAEPIETIVDPETGDEVSVYPKSAEEKYDFQNGWAVRSRGQVICTEITIKPGTSVGVGSTYNPATVDEFELKDTYPVTDFYVNISEWNTNAGDPRSGMIYTTKKFKGPFAIVSYISNGNSGTGPKCVFETGTDIDGDAVETEWNQIGDTCVLNKGQRLYQKFVRVYEGTDEVYLRTRIADGGSKAGYYDIYVLGLDPASISDGIQELNNQQAAGREAVYSLDGVRLPTAKRGVNIIRQSDGTIRKVMVK